MSEQEVKKDAPAAEQTKEATPSAAPAPEASAQSAEPQVKLKPGLFQGFTLGSTLVQGPTGNVMTNMKKPAMDYEKAYKESIKNVQMSAQELEALSQKKGK